MKFRNEYNFLSNMSLSPLYLEIKGKRYRFTCAESAFQACKEPERASEFENIAGGRAKQLGRHVNLPKDWNEKRVNIMRQILYAKFIQNPVLLLKLRNIKEEITEENTWNDTFWGVCNGTGKNMLGKLLMEIRDDESIPSITITTMYPVITPDKINL